MSVLKETIQHPERFTKPDFTKEDVKSAIEQVIGIIDANLDHYGDLFPNSNSDNLVYETIENNQWTTSFYTGMLWLAYEYTRDQKYLDVIHVHLQSFKKRIEAKGKDVQNHDIGFLYTLSWVPALKLLNDPRAKAVLVDASEFLLTRFHPKAEIIQAWGDLTDPNQMGRMIIDCNMNLPLLYFTSEITGDKKYHEIASKHIAQAAKYIVREDASTHHTYYMDVETGEPRFGTTHQGYTDDSCWARGQAWGIYGFALSYKYLKDDNFIDLSKKLTNYYLNRLQDDYICNWDFYFTKEEDQRDSSAAAIAACGMLELSKYLPVIDEERALYEHAAIATLKSLKENYIGTNNKGVLLHGVYNVNKNKGVDEYVIWGDYFYFEGLMRLYKDWNLYW
jgi:unsaturated chondroitin disaccharide hydrolase